MLQNLPAYIAWTRKAIINTIGLLTVLVSMGVLPAPYSVWISSALVVLIAVSHYFTPNADPPGETPALEGPVDEEEQPVEWQPPDSETASEVAVGHQQAAPPPTTSPTSTG